MDERGLTPRKGVMMLVEVEEGVAAEGGDGLYKPAGARKIQSVDSRKI